MKKILLALVLFGFAAELAALETIKISEIKPGMKGYGLTVFKGFEIEKFDVEVIDIMPRALPDVDMILVRCSGAGLEKSKLIAGMSGSPIYLEDKLAGAIAYTWSFQQEPVAGVTPIQNMIEATTKNLKPGLAASADSSKDLGLNPALKPVGCPILVSGLEPSLFPEARKILEQFNLGPVTTGGGRAKDLGAPQKLEPGSAVGVELITGDLDIAAVGTATMVEGNTVLAFGHGFFNGGAVSLPLALAKVNTVIASSLLSFKLASTVREVGTLFGDFPAAVSGRLGQKAEMIPVQVSVKNLATLNEKSYRYQIADHPVLTLNMLQLALLQSVLRAGAISENATVNLDMNLSLQGYPEKIHYQDKFALSRGSFSGEYLIPAVIFANNPYKKIKFSGFEFNLEVKPGWELAEIKSVWANKMELSPGDSVTIGVRLRKYQGEEFEKVINFKIPMDAQGGISLNIMGGSQMPLDIAAPESIDDLINVFKKVPSPTWLVVQYQQPGVIVDYQGERMRGLPPSAQALFSGWANTEARRSPDFAYLTFDMPYIIKGAGALRFLIKPETERGKK